MPAVKIAPDIYWVGAIDWNLRFCGSYTTPRGTTYNSYLIIDDKIALVDAVKNGFEHIMLERIREIVDPAKIDYIICQHSERDHAGCLPELKKYAVNAKIIATKAGKDGLLSHFGTDWNAEAVKTGDTLKLGKRTLEFIEAAMLHWPDNMFTYVKEEEMLFTNDAFGQHIATHQRFDDELGDVVMREAARYFAVIVSMYSNLAQDKLKELEKMKLNLKMIAPAHGLIWRGPGKIIDAYKRWSSGEAEPKVTIVFDTMWQSTDKMAQEIARGIEQEGVDVTVFNLRSSDWSEIMADIMESRIIAIGSPVLNMGMYPTVGGFMTFLKGIRPVNKKAASFGSYGWGKGAVKAINEELTKMNIEVLDSIEIRYVPTPGQLSECFEFGRKIAGYTRG
ncbi:MAG: FprA family A-type flavoprotein [Candidatus Omnitrophica bacterium]|nr:FprA family A-type flavoprotein [Candidatus Omnitrophota bacterium]